MGIGSEVKTGSGEEVNVETPDSHQLGQLRAPDTNGPSTRAELLALRNKSDSHAGGMRRVNGLSRWLALVGLCAIVLAIVAQVNDRLSAPPVRVSVRAITYLDPTVKIPGDMPALPWPATGEAAVSIPTVGFQAHSSRGNVAPIASLTKIMTAYLILTDHPLTARQDGPTVTVTQADVSAYDTDVGLDESSVAVAAGEVLSERQLLEGLLVHSANNYADILATWDAGSVPAFVAKMNATAEHLSMDSTHYADASGFSAQSVSTPQDVLKVTARALAIPTFAQIVKMSSVSLPVAGVVSTYTPMLGIPGVVGVKSGYTQPAGGCDVLAIDRDINGSEVVALAAVTAKTGVAVLDKAGLEAFDLATHALGDVTTRRVVVPGMRLATLSFGGRSVGAVTTGSVVLYVVPGSTIRESVKLSSVPRAGSRTGAMVGELTVSSGLQSSVVVVRSDGNLPAEPLIQRLL